MIPYWSIGKDRQAETACRIRATRLCRYGTSRMILPPPSPSIGQPELITMCRLANRSRSPPFVRSPRPPPKHIRPPKSPFFLRRHRLSHFPMRIHQPDTTRSLSLLLNPPARLQFIAKARQARRNGSTAPWIVHRCETRVVENHRGRFDRDQARSPGPPEPRIRWRFPASCRATTHRNRPPVRCPQRDNFESP